MYGCRFFDSQIPCIASKAGWFLLFKTSARMWSPLVVVFLEVSFDAFCSFQARELNAVHLLSNFVPSFEVMLKELSHSSRPPTTTGANNKNWGLSHGTPCPQHAYRRSNFLTTCHLLVGILYWVLSINFCSCNQVEEHREKGGVRIETANHKLITCPIPVDLVEHVSYYDEQGSDGSCMKQSIKDWLNYAMSWSSLDWEARERCSVAVMSS